MSVGRFIAGFVVGGAVGALVGILLAPQSGEETREILTEGAQDAYKNAKSTVREIQDKADDVIDEMQRKGEDIISKIQGMINKQKDEVSA